MGGETVDELIWRLEQRRWSRPDEDALKLTYLELDVEAARRLAIRAATIPLQARVLFRVACFFPDALEGLHRNLLDDGVLDDFSWPYAGDYGVIFAAADRATRDRLIAEVETGADSRTTNNARSSLAWIGDEAAADAFRRWDDQFYPLTAGWELSGNGGRRRLTVTERCRRLVHGADPSPAVVVIDDHDGACVWCGGGLTVLFNLDLRHRELAFLGMDGRRLRVVTCEACTCDGVIFTDVDLDGLATWSSHNRRPDWVSGPPSTYGPRRELQLASFRRAPCEAMAFGRHMSQIGGQATWIQPPEYPLCPLCARRMTFLAQVDTLSEFPLAEGMIYAFVDIECMIVATWYQQT